MAIRAGLGTAVEELTGVAARWEDAYRVWKQAIQTRDRLAARADRRVLAATGGLSVARFEAVCGRRSVRSVAEAEQKAQAIRSRPAVTAALADRDRAVTAAAAAVLIARVGVAVASKVLVGYGSAGPRLVGRSPTDLRRLARLPSSCARRT